MKSNKINSVKKIKICWVANSDMAVKFLLLPQLKFLIKEGFEIYVVCSPGNWVGYIESVGIKVKTIRIKRKISPFYDLISILSLWLYFKKEKFDIVHTNNPKPGLIGQIAAKLSGVPIIVNTIHGLYFDNSSSSVKNNFFGFLEKIASKCSDLIFSVNKEDMETLINGKVTQPKKIKYLGNGVNLDKFDSGKFSKEFIDNKKRELGIPAQFKVIGIVARLVEEKGYLDLFDAFKIILKSFSNVVLLIVGPQEFEKNDSINPKIVNNYGIENNVIFLGERDDVEYIYPLMDIFVLPSYREGLPISILEAMAEKRAIVATDIRGCREEIQNGKTGILVPPKKYEDLAKAIIYLLNHNDDARKMAFAARAIVEKEFDEKLVFDRIKESYKFLILNKIKK